MVCLKGGTTISETNGTDMDLMYGVLIVCC
jgi:hypothetical protein